MPRRPAPTPLRLSQGPLPKRSEPKHTLPSLPRPVFHPPPRASQGPLPRERAQAYALKLEQAEDSRARAPVAQPAYGLPTGAVSPTSSSWSSTSKRRGHSRQSSTSSLSSNSSFSSRSSRESSRRSSLDEENPNAVYGPWVKHGKGFALPFDPNTLIMPPRPAAINPLPVW